MKKIFKSAALATILCAGLIACSDLNDLEKRMDMVESRIQALETVIPALNGNIDAMKKLMEAGSVNSIVEKDGAYVITFSNGETVTLTQGSIGVGNAPVMGIDKDGYWTVDCGNGPENVLQDGKKVPAKGTDGVTPQFGVSSDGNWTVSYDGGKTFSNVPGADGKPVSAIPGGEVSDQYFKNVEYKESEGMFIVTLKDNTVLSIPVLPSFLCSITADGLQIFSAGETKTFPVEMKGVSKTIVTAPDGWKTSLSETVLSVTAPVGTRAVLADNTTDISILAIATQGMATVAKLLVSLDSTPVTIEPKATVTAGEVTETSATFSVSLVDAASWKYIVKPSSEAAPSADDIADGGIAGNGASVIVEGLTGGVAYTIYVLPLNGSIKGEVATASATTEAPVINDLYQAYSEGKTIIVCGKPMTKTGDEAVLLSSSEAGLNIRSAIHQKENPVVLFLEAADGADFSITGVTEIKGDITIVSRYADKPVTLKPVNNLKFIKGALRLEGIDVDLNNINGASNAGYFANNGNATADFTEFSADRCRFRNITKPMLYCSVAGYGFKSMSFTHCSFEVKAEGNIQLFNLYKSTVLDHYDSIRFDNNTVYNATGCVAIQIINYDQTVAQSGTAWNLDMSICHNIFYNCPSANGFFKFYQVASLAFNYNVFAAPAGAAGAAYGFILYGAGQTAAQMNTSSNIAYGLTGNWNYAHSTSTYKPENNIIGKLADSPFETEDAASGTFKLAAAYAEYGPENN